MAYHHPFLNPYGLPKNSWGYRVFQLRHALGWSQSKLARVMGCNAMVVSNLERGAVSRPGLITIHRIKKVESMYADILQRYKKAPIRLSRLQDRDKRPYGHNQHGKYYAITLLPIEVRRPEDIESLGKVEADSKPIFFGRKTRENMPQAGMPLWRKARNLRRSKTATQRHRAAAAKRGGEH